MKKTLLFMGLAFLSTAFYAQNPVLLNPTFNKIVKSGGSDCSCSGWRNTDIIAEGESSTSDSNFGSDDGMIKFDARESDGAYQEIEVLANTTYKITLNPNFKDDSDYTPTDDASLEIRILKGSGYFSGYTPTYLTDATTTPKNGYGYTSITDVELAANNIQTLVIAKPTTGNVNDPIPTEITFNTGSETSIAIFLRGIGRAVAPVDDKPSGITWSAGDQEIRIGEISIAKQSVASVDDVFSSKISVYPNPAKNFIKISSSEEITGVEMFNLIGKSVLKTSSISYKGIDTSKLSKGIYILKVSSNDLVGSRKVIIE